MIHPKNKGEAVFETPVSAVIYGKGGICHGFMAIGPAIFGAYIPEASEGFKSPETFK